MTDVQEFPKWIETAAGQRLIVKNAAEEAAVLGGTATLTPTASADGVSFAVDAPPPPEAAVEQPPAEPAKKKAAKASTKKK